MPLSRDRPLPILTAIFLVLQLVSCTPAVRPGSDSKRKAAEKAEADRAKQQKMIEGFTTKEKLAPNASAMVLVSIPCPEELKQQLRCR